MTVILVVNLLALSAGAAVIALASGMARRCRLAPVRDYLVFVSLAVVSGFFDWIVFNLIRTLVPGMPLQDVEMIYHVFWDLIGFPCAMGAAAGLLFALAGFLDIRPGRKAKTILAAPFLVLSLVSVLRMIAAAGEAASHYSPFLWKAFTIALPTFHVLLLGAAYARAWRLRGPRGSSREGNDRPPCGGNPGP